LRPTDLARGNGDVQRQSAVDPVAGVDRLDELIVYPVEFAQMRREPTRVESGGA
jgi:hypothetical protein